MGTLLLDPESQRRPAGVLSEVHLTRFHSEGGSPADLQIFTHILLFLQLSDSIFDIIVASLVQL